MIGRVLGLSVRVIGQLIARQLAPRSSLAAPPPLAQPASPATLPIGARGITAQTAGPMATQAGPSLHRGLGGILQPFRRVGGIVWLEVTGFLFLLFAAIFVLRLWQNWAGLSHQRFELYSVIAVAVVFAWLGVSSFWRARRRSRRS
jgi:hypothetical protein